MREVKVLPTSRVKEETRQCHQNESSGIVWCEWVGQSRQMVRASAPECVGDG